MEQLVNEIIERLKLSNNKGYKDGIAFERHQGDCSNVQIVMTFIKPEDDIVNIQWNLAIGEEQAHIYSLYEVQEQIDVNFRELLSGDISDEKLQKLNHIRAKVTICEPLIRKLIGTTSEWSETFQKQLAFDGVQSNSNIVLPSQYQFNRH